MPEYTKMKICNYLGGDIINYIVIPREIIYEKDFGNLRVIAFSYFATKRSLDDTVGFSCDNLVKWCGYSPNYNKGKSNDIFMNTISMFRDNGYLEIKDINKRNIYNMVKIINEKFDVPNQFALIYLDEVKKIQEFKKYTKDTVKMTSSILLLVLSYIRVNMLRRQKEYIGHPSDKPEFCYRMFIDIERDIGLSSRYISRAVKILEDIGLIVTKTLPRYKDENGKWHTEVTLFVNRYKRKNGGDSLDVNYNYEQELLWGVDYIKNKKFLSKEFYQNTEH